MADKPASSQVIGELEDLILGAQAIKANYEQISAAFGDIGTKITSQITYANDLRIQFQQTFGMFEAERGRALVKNFADQSVELIKSGVSANTLAQAYKMVGENINTFAVKRTDEAVKSFSELAAVNNKLGIDMQSTTGIINYLATGFGKSESAITSFSNKLVQFSRETGQEFKKVFNEFNQSISKFYTILDPEKAATQFMSFQQMARGFGSTIDTLMATAAKFDDIEQGVQFGTQLNNVLSAVGGSFDSMLASTMNYDDRIKLVVQSIASSRDQINSMSEVSQRAYIRQLQQTTGLGGETIQAILRNNELVNSMDKLTGKEFTEVKEAKVKDIADDFTKALDRQNLFINQYLKIGARMEAFVDQQSKNVSSMQNRILGPAADIIAKSRSVVDGLAKIDTYFASLIKQDFGKKLEDEIKTQVASLKVAIDRGLAAGGTPLNYSVATATTPATRQSPSLIYPDLNIKIKEGVADGTRIGVADGIKQGTEAAAKLLGNREIVITVNPTDEFRGLLRTAVEVFQTGRK